MLDRTILYMTYITYMYMYADMHSFEGDHTKTDNGITCMHTKGTYICIYEICTYVEGREGQYDMHMHYIQYGIYAYKYA
jgi:hypothetical protein